MAIYKNREVSVIGPNTQANAPTSINVRYVDGTHENVSLYSVYFTEDEKKWLIKTYPSRFDDVSTISDDDIKMVRIGVAPSTDKTAMEQAKVAAQHEMQSSIAQKRSEEMKAKQKAELDKQLNAPVKK